MLVFATGPLFAQANIGFENGTFDNWEFAVGRIETNGDVFTNPTIAVPGNFAILKNDQSDTKDDYGNFSVFSPNGSKYSVKLGNSLYGNSVQQMSYTLTVPPSGSNSIIFDYAVVLVNPGHDPNQQPRFTVKIYNITDAKYLECPAFDFISSSNLPGFKFNSDGVFYKDWSSATINLTGLNNKKVRLEFTVNHCPFGEHFGYAYIDVNENISAPVTGNSYCTNQTAITLSAPPGFASYTWFSSDFKTTLGTGQHLAIPPPPNLTKLAVKVTPYNGLGCTDTLYTVVNGIDGDFKFIAKPSIIGCPGRAVDLTQNNVIAGSNTGLTFDYLTDAFQPLASPSQITNAGVYYIRATNAGGCSNVLPVTVSFGLPQLAVTNPPAVIYPATVDLSEYYVPQPNVQYSYYKDELTTLPLENFKNVPTSGKYYIKAETSSGCANVQPINVTVLPPQPFSIIAPNAFTPNDDGINDRFSISLDGYITFNSLQIYNRNGTPILQTTNSGQYWDGKYHGSPLPAGTYYWVFEGFDNYYRKKIKKSSFITLIR